MNQEYFQQWTMFTKNLQQPFQSLVDLNLKTLQQFSYLKPEEMINIKKPEDFIEKQIALTLKNGQNALDYLKKSFEIMEKTLLSVNDKIQETSNTLNSAVPGEMGREMSTLMQKSSKSAVKAARSIMETASSMDSSHIFDPSQIPKPQFSPKLAAKSNKKQLAETTQAGAQQIKSSDLRKTRKNPNDGKSGN